MYKRKQRMEVAGDEPEHDHNLGDHPNCDVVGELEAGRRVQTRYTNKQRTMVLATQGIQHSDRHLMNDLRDLLPHSKKDAKFDAKARLWEVNEVCDVHNCSSCLLFEARRHSDLYLWMCKTPHGPSAKFLVQNVHTMAELKMTGNCMKGSRPVLSFDASFDRDPHMRLLKQMFVQVFGSPRGHPKTKPFVDHVFSFYYLDGRIWFRNYQLVYEVDGKSVAEPALVEIGPRFCLLPIKIFAGSFQGETLYSNGDFVTPSKTRSLAKRQLPQKYIERVQSAATRQQKMATFKDTTEPLDLVFHEEDDDASQDDDESSSD